MKFRIVRGNELYYLQIKTPLGWRVVEDSEFGEMIFTSQEDAEKVLDEYVRGHRIVRVYSND